MVYKVLQATALFKEPKLDADILTALMEGELLTFAGEKQDNTWVKVKHPAVADPGWVQSKDCEEVEAGPRPPVKPEDFVPSCVLAERAVNAQPATAPFFAAADFVIARAIIETGIANVGPKIPGSDGVGPLQVTSAEWDAFLKSPLGIDGGFAPGGRDEPTVQTTGAAFRMFTDAKAISDAQLAKNVGTASDPFIPSYLDVFHAYLTNSVAAAIAILNVSTSDADKDKKLDAILKEPLTDEQLAALFNVRSQFAGTAAEPKTVAEFVAATTAALNDALKQAFDLISKFAPEQVPSVKQGEAPWFDVAEEEEKAGIAEPDPRILTYFELTDFRPLPTSTDTPWCGAFAAFCMAQSGSAAAKAAIPAGSAQAAKWKGWGTQLPLKSDNIPPGAVVMLSPGEGTGGSGHVAFFVGYAPDGKTVELLGGNQSNRVKRSHFPVSQIAAICWLDLAPALTAEQNDATPSDIPISKDAFNLIIEFEVTSQEHYEKRLRAPEWPGESSGVTIGIGYDVGQTKASVFESDWKDVIDDRMFDALRATVGITGPPAKARARALKGVVDIPWEKALKVHTERVVPRWVGLVKAKLDNTELLNEDCLGALVSLTFNRGVGGYISGKPRFQEMVLIKECMANKRFREIPDLILAMRRLWPGTAGLQDRRRREAKFFKDGLARMSGGGG